jgi:hypothetical protein
MRIILIILVFPTILLGQTHDIYKLNLTDSIKSDLSNKFYGIEGDIFNNVVVQRLDLFELNDSINCSKLDKIKLTDDKHHSSLVIGEKDLIEIFLTDYLKTYISPEAIKYDKAYDGLSDTTTINVNGSVTWVVIGRGGRDKLFTLKEIESIKYLINKKSGKLEAVSFVLLNQYLDLPSSWIKVSEIYNITELRPFIYDIQKLIKNSILIEEKSFC